MAGTFKNRKLFLAWNPLFKRQSAWDSPLVNADISSRHPQATPTFPSNQFTREETRDCSGEYVIFEEITSRLKRLRFGFNGDSQINAGWLAFAMGAAAAPTGTPADEVQTLTSSATSGTFKLTFDFEGLSDETSDISVSATAAQIQAALEALRSIKSGNVLCAGGPLNTTPVTVTFQGALAKADVSLLTADNALAVGGTVVPSQTTAGANKLHAISRGTSDQPPQTSIIYGFEGDTTNPIKGKNVVVNSVAFSGSRRGKVLTEIDLIFSGDIDEALSYTVPACVNFTPVKCADVRLKINAEYYTQLLREFRYEYSNNILTGDDPFPFDDIDAIRLERGDRTSSFTFTVDGSRGDGLYTLIEPEPQEDIELHIGEAGDRLSILAPSAKLKFQDDDITFVGEANRSAIQFTGTPFLAGAGTPDSAEAKIAQATAYLLS